MWVRFLGWEDPLEEGMETHSSILAWRIHGQRSLVSHSPWCCRDSDTSEGTEHARMQSRFYPLLAPWINLLLFFEDKIPE